jgi:hypothetical protein
MPYPEHPNDRPLDTSKTPVKALVMVLAVGLVVLNLTLYLGMAAAQNSFAVARPRQDASYYAQPEATPATFHEGGSVTAGN